MHEGEPMNNPPEEVIPAPEQELAPVNKVDAEMLLNSLIHNASTEHGPGIPEVSKLKEILEGLSAGSIEPQDAIDRGFEIEDTLPDTER